MSPAGTSVCSPMWRCSSVMKDWQNRMISRSDLPAGSKSEPPLPPPIGMPVSEFLKICSKPRNLTIPRYTEGWKRSPPLYGPSAELNSTRNPRLTCTTPASSIHGTRKMIWRSGSQRRCMTPASTYWGWRCTTGPSASNTSDTAWWNSASPGLRANTSSRRLSRDSFMVSSSDIGIKTPRGAPAVARRGRRRPRCLTPILTGSAPCYRNETLATPGPAFGSARRRRLGVDAGLLALAVARARHGRVIDEGVQAGDVGRGQPHLVRAPVLEPVLP